MNHLSLIIKREYLTKVRNKSFVIMTFLSPFIFVGIFALVAYLSSLNSDTIRRISVLDNSGLFIEEFNSSPHSQYKILQNITLDEAKKQAEKEDINGLLYIPKTERLEDLSKGITFYSEDSPSLSMMGDINNLLESKANALKLREAGIDAETIKNLHINIDANQETFQGKETSKLGSGLKLAFGGAAGYLLFMFIIIYGNMIMRSVIEEKTSRIIEVIISSVKPRLLLLGKIFGTTLAGITQFLIWVVLIVVLMTVVTSVFGIDPAAGSPSQQIMENKVEGGAQQVLQDIMVEINNLPILNLILMFILFFVGGYLLYASLYAAVGAAVDSETDTQQFMMPILMPLILAVYVGFFTVIDNPHGTVSQVFSYIPFTSPVVMLMRIPFGVPLWQQLISVVLLFATFIGMVWFAAKIYRVGILMYGKKPTYKEIFKWLKY
ncbi:ABC transporter permease [Aequorivita sp. SDUM287046]|uniref:ABC transporter permease n=1 Tax=Aequorivita aurantiaca TaxID=3053356 RepID=A0ABT8DNL0_9FLAO|nr:ABC transporter permease [Aequorivita aurantiaca]MDN3724657.1 ABC transporter permease [Aequorivita aurantiaca]